jgi:type IV secretion system protein VirB5
VVNLPVAMAKEPPGSPYPLARFDRGDLYATTRKALRRAQLLGFLLGALALALAGGVLHLSGRARVIPYVVEVDRHGAPLAYGPAEEMSKPDRRILLHTLALWVRSTRTVTADRELMKKLLETGYELTGGRAVALLNGWYESHPPFARAVKETVSVQAVESILAAGSTDHWRLQWTEEVRNPGGVLLSREHWQALAQVEIDPPETVEQVLVNPLGIRVTDFDWQRLSTTDPRKERR